MASTTIRGRGAAAFSCSPDRLAGLVLEPEPFVQRMPLVRSLRRHEQALHAVARIGAGPLRSDYAIRVVLRQVEAYAFLMGGECRGSLLKAESSGQLRVLGEGASCRVEWEFSGTVHGPFAMAGTLVVSRLAQLYVEGFMRAADAWLAEQAVPLAT